MKYYFTDFYHWEQPKIDQLRREGKFVYSVIDTGGEDFLIVRKQCCNRFAFLITDEDILALTDSLTNDEFSDLGGEEDIYLDITKKDMSVECAAARKEYERRQKNETL